MKKLLFALVFGAVFTIQAQYEVKINPIMTALGQADISGEYLISETFGVELSLQPYFGKAYEFSNSQSFTGKQSGIGEKLRVKYYYSPYNGGDSYYVDLLVTNASITTIGEEFVKEIDGEYVKLKNTFKQSYFGVGFELGYKYVFDSGIVFEYALGAGSFLSNNLKVIPDPLDTEGKVEKRETEVPLFFTGKFVIGYRFGDY